MNKENMYRVTSPSGSVSEYFNCRQSAIDFIVDEFAMAVTFRTDNEGERLAEYMLTNNETPNQYPYKYKIEEIRINHEYDKPKSIYMVKVDSVNQCVSHNDEFLYTDYESAREHFDNLVDDDIKFNGENPNVESKLSPTSYDRWYDNEGYCVDHFNVELIEFVDNNGTLTKKVQY